MEKDYSRRVVAWWTSGRTGLAKSDSAPNAIHFTAPPQFGGIEGRWTPEDLLLCALASCFTTTFYTLAGNSEFEFTDLQVEAEGVVGKTTSGYSFSRITIRPKLTIAQEDRRERGQRLLEKSKELCLVSRALAATQKVESQIVVGKRETG
jgi:organic hydroperoxide reductase OsmC/OhrA